MKRIEIHVVCIDREWWVTVGGLRLKGISRDQAIWDGRRLARWHGQHGKSELVVHRVDGTIGERNTYPRSSDPSRSRG